METGFRNDSNLREVCEQGNLREVCEKRLLTLLNKIRADTLSKKEYAQIYSILSKDICSDEQSVLSYLYTGWYVQTQLKI